MHVRNRNSTDRRIWLFQVPHGDVREADRIRQLDSVLSSSRYSQGKSRTQRDLENFLESQCYVDTSRASPFHVRRYLVYKEKFGKTKIHDRQCGLYGNGNRSSCSCPQRMAWGSVDSLIGQLRAIFRDAGRGSEWVAVWGLGNPAAAPSIKQHLKAVRLEQAVARVRPKKATPLLPDKMVKLVRFLRYQLSLKNTTHKQKLLILRDMAYLTLLWHSGDRGADLSLLTARDVLYYKNDPDTWLFRHVMGKTARVDRPEYFALKRSQGSPICPMSDLEQYRLYASSLGCTLTTGYIFRPISLKGPLQLLDKPLSVSVMSGRLKKYLQDIGLWEGETIHSARGGCATALRLLKISDTDISGHVGWHTPKMITSYTNQSEFAAQMRVASSMADTQWDKHSDSLRQIHAAQSRYNTSFVFQ